MIGAAGMTVRQAMTTALCGSPSPPAGQHRLAGLLRVERGRQVLPGVQPRVRLAAWRPPARGHGVSVVVASLKVSSPKGASTFRAPGSGFPRQANTSRPFPKPKSGRIAVKVINYLGDEVMKVFRV